MLVDPQSVTISGTAISLPRISTGETSARYRTPSGDYTLSISHVANKRERSVVRLDLSKVGTDPLVSTQSRVYTASVYLVVDSPLNGAGFTDAELENATEGLTGLINGGTFLAKFLGKES